MKNTCILLIAIFIVFSCTERSEQEDTTAKELSAVCIWEGSTLRDAPSKQAKWLASISLGETLTMLGDTAIDSTDKNREFYNIRLSDGKQGWVQAYLLAIDAKPAAFIQKAVIHKRPDLLTGTDNAFETMEMVAVLNEQDDWLEVIGNKRKKSGWIKNENVTFNDKDVAVAILATKAFSEKDQERKDEKIKEILDNSALSGSVFIEELQRLLYPEEAEIAKAINVNEILELIFSKEYTEINKYIHPENGIYVLGNPGAFTIATKNTSFEEIIESDEWIASQKIDCAIKYEALPEVECDKLNGWSKQGCFSDDVKNFNKISAAANYSVMAKEYRISGQDIKEVKNIESTVSLGVILTADGMSFYFSLIDGKWYITVLDLVTPCEA